MIIDETGNIGIKVGSANPVVSLQVNGLIAWIIHYLK